MAEIIPFDSPMIRLKRELEEKEKELQDTKRQLYETRQSISAITSVNELLKLQLHDLTNNIRKLQENLNIVTGNVQLLQSKLPTIEIKGE
jgi:chromosome segregation ATPase